MRTPRSASRPCDRTGQWRRIRCHAFGSPRGPAGIRLQVPGRFAIVGATVSSVLGTILGWRELVVGAAIPAAALLLAAFYVARRAPYRAEVTLPDSVLFGRDAVAVVTLRSASHRHLSASRAEVIIEDRSTGFVIAALAGGGSSRATFELPTTRRGIIAVGPVCSVRRDPLSLICRATALTGIAHLPVQPRTVPVGDRVGEVRAGFENCREREEWRSTSWPSSAYPCHRIERRSGVPLGTRVVVALDVRSDGFASPADFELAVSTAASIACRAFADDDLLAVFSGPAAHSTTTRRTLLDGFAGVVPRQDAKAMSDLERRLVANASPTAVVLVVGPLVTAAELCGKAFLRDVNGTTIVLRCAAGAPLGLSRIARLHIVTLGHLEALPAAMRAIS